MPPKPEKLKCQVAGKKVYQLGGHWNYGLRAGDSLYWFYYQLEYDEYSENYARAVSWAELALEYFALTRERPQRPHYFECRDLREWNAWFCQASKRLGKLCKKKLMPSRYTSYVSVLSSKGI